VLFSRLWVCTAHENAGHSAYSIEYLQASAKAIARYTDGTDFDFSSDLGSERPGRLSSRERVLAPLEINRSDLAHRQGHCGLSKRIAAGVNKSAINSYAIWHINVDEVEPCSLTHGKPDRSEANADSRKDVLAVRTDALVGRRASRTRGRSRPGLDDGRKRKGKHQQYSCELGVSIFHVTEFPFIVLAFRDLPSLRTHFRPFTEVVRKSRTPSYAETLENLAEAVQ